MAVRLLAKGTDVIKYLTDCEAEGLQDFPYCVVGSGAAGISMAVALSRAGKRVLLLEAGDWHEDDALTDAYAGHAAPPHAPTTDYRRQRFGGTTHLWGGRCVPLDDHDFEARSGVPHSGWPIQAADLAPYWGAATAYCDAGEADFELRSLGAHGQQPMFADLPGLAPALFERIERYSLPTDFGRKFKEELTQSTLVTVLLKAKCLALKVNADGALVEQLIVGEPGRQVALRAGQVILCGGGLESTRLLLMARQATPAWSRFDASLGKYYACHYDAIYGALQFTGKRPVFHFQRTSDGVYARRKLHFSAEFQRENSLLNSTFRLHFPPYGDPSHGSGVLSLIYLLKSILAREHQDILNHGRGLSELEKGRMQHVRNVLTDPGSVLTFGFDWLFKMKLATRRLPYTLIPNRNGSYPLEFNSEQQVDEANRIELLPEHDKFGMPRLSVKWRLTGADVDSGVRSFECLQALLARTPNVRLAFDPVALREQMAAALPVGGHHMGTTRMSETATTGVVDRNAKVHGVGNLYVASSSVFPTSSHANPTLTIVALALRLADHLVGASTRHFV